MKQVEQNLGSSITNNTLYHDDSKNKLGPFFSERNFQINLKNIAIIGLKKGVFFDDDYTVIVMISDKLKFYFFPYEYFTNDDVLKINKYFNIDLEEQFIIFSDIQKFPFSQVIFPSDLSNHVIFKKHSFLKGIKLFIEKITLRKRFPHGVISEKVLAHIKNLQN